MRNYRCLEPALNTVGSPKRQLTIHNDWINLDDVMWAFLPTVFSRLPLASLRQERLL